MNIKSEPYNNALFYVLEKSFFSREQSFSKEFQLTLSSYFSFFCNNQVKKAGKMFIYVSLLLSSYQVVKLSNVRCILDCSIQTLRINSVISSSRNDVVNAMFKIISAQTNPCVNL